MSRSTGEYRACFDFEVDFSNGGGIQGQGFRLDIDGDDIDDQALADYIVCDMQLLMVGAVRIRNKKIIRERHKRQPQAAPSNALRPDLIDLSHVVHSGEEVYPGLPAPRVSDHLSHQASVGRYAEGVTFQIARIDMVANSGTAIDAPSHRYPGATDVAHLALGDIADVDAVVVHLQGMQGRSIDRAVPRWRRSTCAAARCCSTPAGPPTGALPPICRRNPSSAATARSTCAITARCWSASTRSTSTTPAIRKGPPTRSCWPPASRSSRT